MRAAILAALSLAVASPTLAAGPNQAISAYDLNPLAQGPTRLAQATTPEAPAPQAPAAETPAPQQTDSAGGEGADDDADGGLLSDESAFPENFQFSRIPVTFQPSADSPGLTEFLTALKTIVQMRDEPALMKAIAPKLFWDRDFGDSADQAQTGEWNFRQAMQIGVPDLDPSYADEGWKRLATLLATTRISTEADHPGAYCLPAYPSLADETAATKTFEAAGMAEEWQMAWGYVDGKVEVMDKLGPGAATLTSLDTEAVPVLSWAADDDMNWAQVGLPDGKTGYVKSDLLGSWINERLCFAKNDAGEWQIAGYVGGGD